MIGPVVNVDRCKGCGLCIAVCPKDTLQLSHDLNTRGVRYARACDHGECNMCGSCYMICPDAAIEIKQIVKGVEA